MVEIKRKSTKQVVYGTTKELIVSFTFKYKPLRQYLDLLTTNNHSTNFIYSFLCI